MGQSDLAVWNVSKQIVDTGSKKNANKIIFTYNIADKTEYVEGLKI